MIIFTFAASSEEEALKTAKFGRDRRATLLCGNTAGSSEK